MIRIAQVLLSVTGFAGLLAALAGQQPEAGQANVSLELLNFDRQGKLLEADEDRLEKISERFRKKPPSHVFVMSHGWNNSQESARKSYEKMLDEMRQLADAYKLRPAGAAYRPAVIGLHWPSLAFENDEDLAAALLSRLSDKNARRLRFLVKLSYGADDLRPFLNQQMSPDNVLKAFALARLYLDDELAVPAGANAPDLRVLDEKDVATVLQAARVFTFWSMKKRAGTVGENGARRVLMELQAAAPHAQYHLVGHSFGCKVLLSALSGDAALVRPVDSLVLLQGAISTQSFADEVVIRDRPMQGGYYVVAAKGRVRGPIVATFSERDLALKWAYPAASQAAGQVAELEVGLRHLKEPAYRGMGAWGIEGIAPILARKASESYSFKNGLNSVDATDAIRGHSEVLTPAIARIIWSAMLSR
jgi:hypothetical protein